MKVVSNSTRVRDGGPVFPTPQNAFGENSPSISLRDWFAGQAAAGMMADRAFRGDNFAEACATQAYMVADAMIAEREKQETE